MLGGGSVNGASLSRGNFIVYNSPTLGGFSLSGDWGENDAWDVALRYAGEFRGFRVAAGIGYPQNYGGLNEVTGVVPVAPTGTAGCNNGTIVNIACDPSVWQGSASILHVASGLYLTGAYLRQDNDIAGVDDTTMWYLQGGIGKNWTGLGKTVIYGEYARVGHGLMGATSGSKCAETPT
jgi:hypothetical protein